MADLGSEAAVEGSPDTGKETGTPMDITPSRRSSRKKQSTFSDDFEYYTPTGRKKEDDKKPTPQQVPKGKQQKESQKDGDDEEEKEENVEKKVPNKKVGKKNQKGKSIGDEEESDEDVVQKPKPKVGKGKPKIIAKKTVKKSPAILQKKKSAVKKQKESSEEEEEDTSGEESEEDVGKVVPGNKRKAAKSLTKVQPGKTGKAARKKKKGEEKDVEEEEESSSDEEDSTPISQLQAQLKQKQAAAKEVRQSPLAQNLAKKLVLEIGADSSTSLEGEDVPTLGQKRKSPEDAEEASPAKKTANVSQVQKLGSALASLVKRFPPADLGLVKRTPKEMASKVSKQALVNSTAVKEEDIPAAAKIKSASIEESKPIDIIAPPNLVGTSKDIAVVEKVKQEDGTSEKKPDISAGKKKMVKFDTESVASNKTTVKSEKDKLKGVDGPVKRKVKFEEKKIKGALKGDGDKQPKTVLTKDGKVSVLATGLTKDGKVSVLATGHKADKESSLKRETGTGKQGQSRTGKLSESELRQKKIEQIKAKIAEKSAGQKSFLEKQSKSKQSDGSSSKHSIKKEGIKESEMHKKKLEQIKAKVEVSSKKFSNLPSHLSKKKSESKGHVKSNEDIIKRGIVLKKKSHQPFGNKNVVRKLSDKSSNSKDRVGSNSEVEKKSNVERDKIRKPEQRRRKSSESEKRKSIEAKEERRMSNDGNKKQSSSSEKRRKSLAGEDSGSKETNKDTNASEPPQLTPANAAAPTKSAKHKHHKPEHEVPVDMSMMDLFKPDGLIVHDPATTAAAATATTTTSQTEPVQASSSLSSPGCVRPEDVHHVLLEHQYSKTSAAVDSSGASERGLLASGAYQQKSATVASGRDDVESMSHNNSVIMDASLPEQILEESAEELVTSTQDEVTVGNDGGKQESPADRASILESLDTELKESGTDFLIVGQVEVIRQASEVAATSTPSASTQKAQGPSEAKKGSASLPSAAAIPRKRKDSDRSSGSRKKSTDSQSSTADKKKDMALEKKDQKKRKADVKGKGKNKEDETEDVEESGEEDEEYEDDENDFDWEDPDMLYCLCRKPHNNRFMICCDKCEEWYHGTCVGVTRARGKEMEDNEEEYTCPICIKGDGISVLEKAPASSTSTEMSSPATKLLQKCVGRKCSKTPRPGSVYCSNECIMNHAQESLKAIRDEQAKKTSKEKHLSSQENSGKSSSSKTPPPPPPSSTISTSDVVEVMERETGKILRGPSAPTQKGLHRWLEQHPSFEVVQPHKHKLSSRDSRDSKEERSSERKDRRVSSSSSSSSKDKKSDKNDERSHHHHHKDPSRRESSGSNSSREHSSKKVDADRRRSSSSSSSHKVESSSQGSSHRKEEKRSEKSSGGPNQIRINVRTALRDSLYARAKEAEDILLSSNEIKALALEIEENLFGLFNDTGHKYRAKYRSLVFNIKDQKNKGLFRKILGGKISPDKLVMMSTEDLASRELAKWREQESKHQLEMIEKLEKEKQENKTNHVTKKTHKGEIEVNDEDLSTLETRLEEKKETEPDKTDEQAQEPAIDTTSQHRAHLFDLNCKICTGKIVPGPEEQTVPSVSLPAKNKKAGVTFSLPEEKEEKPEPKRGGSSSNLEDIKETDEEDYEKAAEIVKEALEHVHKAEEELSSLPSMVSASPKHHEPALSPPISPKEEPEDVDMDMDEDEDEDQEMEKQPPEAVTEPPPKASGSAKTSTPTANASSSSATVAAAEKKVVVRSPDSALQSGLEAKAKFTPTSPVLWKGFVSMLDVAKFFTSAYRVSGPVDHISIPDTVHIMGRISPDHMWDYLSKIRQAGSKDITLLRFIPGSDEEKVAYIHLYSYLNSRARCGVANNPSRQVKDFYIVPLASHSKIPRTLLPFDGPGLEENRPHMLIGILVRQRDKHSKDASVDSDSPRSSSSSATSKADKVGSSSSAGDGDGGGKTSSSNSKVRTSLSGASRDPRLAKLAAKADSPKRSPTSSSNGNTGNTTDSKPKEPQPSLDSEEYDPEYVPILGKAKGSGSQPVAEYIPTPTAKKKDKEDKNKSVAENKKAVKSKTPSPEDSGSSDTKEKQHHHHHRHKERHRHHRHHHKEHHSQEQDRKFEEDDSEPYSPSKEAEPYSPGMEAAAEEPYDPEDESLMDEDGHPIVSNAAASAPVTASTTASAAVATTSSTTSSTAAAGTNTSTTTTTALSGNGKLTEDTANLSSEELVERMARSNDPSQISTLMVMALSQASTQHQQQELLVKLTRQVEDRKLQLAEEMQRGSVPAQSTATVDTQSEQKQQLEVLAVVTSSESGEEKNKDTSTVGHSSSSSLVSSLAPSNPSLKSHEEVSIKSSKKESDLKTEEAVPGNTSASLSSSQTPSAHASSTLPEKTSSTSSGGIKFSIKSLSKSPLKPVGLGNAFSTSFGKSVQKTPELASSDGVLPTTPAAPEATSQPAPQSTGVSEKAVDASRPQLPDALKALMNDVMGGTEVPSLEHRSKMLIKKEAERTAAMSSKKNGNGEEETDAVAESGKEKVGEEDEHERTQEMAAAALEAQKRLEDEMEARRILDSLKKNAPVASAVPETKPAVEPASKPTTAPTIDELLDRLKKGGFQFPLQKPADSVAATSLSSLQSVPLSSSTGESSSTCAPVSSSSSSSSASVSSSIITSSPPSLSSNPSVPTYTASKPLFPSGTLSQFSSARPPTTSSSSLLSSSEQDVDLRIGIHPQQLPTLPAGPAPPTTTGPTTLSTDRPAQMGGLSPPALQDRDDRLLYHQQDRDDRAYRPGAGPKHPLDPHAFPPLPGRYGTPRLPLPSGPDVPSYQPTPRSILPPKGRAQPPPPGTEFDKPAGVLGITDVDLRHPPLPPLPPQPPPPLPPLPHHQFREDVDYRNQDLYRPHHHGYNRGRGGHSYHRP